MKHPQDKAQRLYINEKKKRQKKRSKDEDSTYENVRGTAVESDS